MANGRSPIRSAKLRYQDWMVKTTKAAPMSRWLPFGECRTRFRCFPIPPLGWSLFGMVVCSTGCSGAPTVTIAGAYFPAWLLSAVIAVVVAMFIRVLMVRTRLADYIPYQLAVCCSIGAIAGLILWQFWVMH
jgi:hypothetical protein